MLLFYQWMIVCKLRLILVEDLGWFGMQNLSVKNWRIAMEMFYHFFKSFSDSAKCNLNISVEGENEHHKIESIFKAFAKSLEMLLLKLRKNFNLPECKGTL